jgi:hypothetical protein
VPEQTRVVVVGDVVGSQRFADQRSLTAGLADALARVDARVSASSALQLLVRDEFSGVYTDLAAAAEATLRLRLATDDLVLATTHGIDEPVELRLGIGVAAAGEHDGEGGGRAGAAWDHARDARAAAQDLPARRSWPASLRSRCHADDPALRATVNAYLLLQDQLLARMDARDRRALVGLLDHERQVDVAAELGVTQPAIARRLRDRGALAIHRALEELRTAARAEPAATDAARPDGRAE